MNRTLSFLALVVFFVFFGVFLYKVQRLDLGIVIVVTLALATFDIWNQLWRSRRR